MKLLTHKFLLVIFYLLSTVISYSTEQPNFKNLIVYSEAKKLKNIEFKNNFNEIIKLNDYKGKLVILNFWATWCAPCLEEMPAFEKLYRRYRSQGLTVIAVSLDKGDTSKVAKFVDEHSLTFPVLLDLDGIAERIYPSFTIPFTYVIDKKGRIAARVDGAKNWSSNETFAALDILIKR